MPYEAPITTNLDGYVAIYGSVAIVIGVMFWFVQRREKKARADYFKGFDLSQLRMSQYKVGLVYRVVSMEENEVAIIPIWNGNQKISDGKIHRVAPDVLIPFDASRFF